MGLIPCRALDIININAGSFDPFTCGGWLGLAIPALRDIQAYQSRFFLIFIVDALTPPTRVVEGHKSLESGEWCDNLVRCRQPPNLEVHLRLTTSIRVEAGTLASVRYGAVLDRTVI